MYIFYPYVQSNVAPDGSREDGTFVVVDGGVYISHVDGGCWSEHECDCSPGHWIIKTFPRSADGVVLGYKIEFESRADLVTADTFMLEQEIQKWLTVPYWEEVAARVRHELQNAERSAALLLKSAMHRRKD